MFLFVYFRADLNAHDDQISTREYDVFFIRDVLFPNAEFIELG